jgi:hypothetical protein
MNAKADPKPAPAPEDGERRGFLAVAGQLQATNDERMGEIMRRHHVAIGLPIQVRAIDVAMRFGGCELHAGVVTHIELGGGVHVYCTPAFRSPFHCGVLKHAEDATGGERMVWQHIGQGEDADEIERGALTPAADAAQP